MYKGFDLSLSRERFKKFLSHNEVEWATILVREIAAKRKNMMLVKDAAARGLFVIDGDLAEETTFPIEPCHVFISHSHGDFDIALALRYALKRWCGLDAFVDSMIWENFRDLSTEMYQKIIAARRITDEEKKQKVWDRIVSHAHCMLTKSLVEMMDECECLIFLNTPNSIQITDGGDTTCSPWIHTELAMSHFLREKPDDRRVQAVTESMKFAFDEDDTQNLARYQADKSNLTILDEDQLIDWICVASKLPRTGELEQLAFRSLNLLYKN